MDYRYFYVISYSILAVFTLIISKFIYSLLKKKTKLSSFYCFLLIIIPILFFGYLFKNFIKVIIDSLRMFVAIFIYALYGLLSGQYFSSASSILLFHIIAILLSIVGLFLVLKFYDKISFKENRILKFFTIGLTIVLSLFLFFSLSFLIKNISLDFLFTGFVFW